MQATVATFVPEAGSGTLLRDDGVELWFGADAFAVSGLRLLRPGQRLAVKVVDGVVVALGLPTIEL